jgi:hypothetical protein
MNKSDTLANYIIENLDSNQGNAFKNVWIKSFSKIEDYESGFIKLIHSLLKDKKHGIEQYAKPDKLLDLVERVLDYLLIGGESEADLSADILDVRMYLIRAEMDAPHQFKNGVYAADIMYYITLSRNNPKFLDNLISTIKLGNNVDENLISVKELSFKFLTFTKNESKNILKISF